MTVTLHDDEPDTRPDVVRTLLRRQAPEFAAMPLERLSNTGSDNALYRLGTAYVVRLPRTASAARGLAVELDWLPRLTGLPTAVPTVVHAGEPDETYPHRWGILRWLEGIDAWEARDQGWFGPRLGHDLAAVVQRLQELPLPTESPLELPRRANGQRGGPLRAMEPGFRRWLDQADSVIDVEAVTSAWRSCLEGADEVIEPTVLHGDLIPGNLLVAGTGLVAVLDWGGLGLGDPAQDLIPAWSVLEADGAAAFAEAVDASEQTWLRARGFALEQAIGGIVYYTPRRHPLADVMRRTLDRLLQH